MRTLTVKTPPMHGPDVVEVQNLLRKHGWTGKADGVYGLATGTQVYREKVALGYAAPDHAAGDVLVAYLSGKRRTTAAMVKRAKGAAKTVSAPGKTTTRPPTANPKPVDVAAAHEAKVRANCVVTMHFLLAHEPHVHYPAGDVRTRTIHQIATLAVLESIVLSAGGLTLDCSQSCTCIGHVSGSKNPNTGKTTFDDDGYTGTLLEGCVHITKAQALPGDLRVYGAGTGHHVGMVLEADSDPLIFSHGQEAGPIAIRDSVESRYQPAGGSWLRLPI